MSAFISKEQMYWFAGVLEGEGCFFLTFREGGALRQATIQCNMTDRDVIERLASVCRYGRVSGPHKQKNARHLDYFRFQVVKRNHVKEIIAEILPLMGNRRKAKIATMLEAIDSQPLRSWSHGTRWGYEGHGCRCDECKRAHADHVLLQARRKGRPEKKTARHGTRSKYVKGCRCQPCRAAALAYERKRAS